MVYAHHSTPDRQLQSRREFSLADGSGSRTLGMGTPWPAGPQFMAVSPGLLFISGGASDDAAADSNSKTGGGKRVSRSVLSLSPIAAHALWAATYDRDPNPLVALEERTVDPLLPVSMEGQVALDVACGTGRWLTKLLRRGATAVGLDLSSEMLHQASRKHLLGSSGLSGSSLIQADCLAVPLRSCSVDLAIFSLGLGYVKDLSGLAKELSRVL